MASFSLSQSIIKQYRFNIEYYFQTWLMSSKERTSFADIIIMKQFIDKKKIKTEKQGNSQFTRSKLESQYNPKYRIFKHQLMSFQKMPTKDRHEHMSKQENQICEKAVQQIKKGSNLVIDWNTKTNFRTTRSILPKLKTQPAEYMKISASFQPQSPTGLTPIEQKRIQLAKLLHVRHKKHYLQTKRQQQQQKALFGSLGSPNSSKAIENSSTRNDSERNQHQRFLFSKKRSTKDDQKLQKVQSQIINESKLQILKEELKTKFVQIRELLCKNDKKKKHCNKEFFD